jgi:cobalt-zinc-cadmium efflux system membrane fusion protein
VERRRTISDATAPEQGRRGGEDVDESLRSLPAYGGPRRRSRALPLAFGVIALGGLGAGLWLAWPRAAPPPVAPKPAATQAAVTPAVVKDTSKDAGKDTGKDAAPASGADAKDAADAPVKMSAQAQQNIGLEVARAALQPIVRTVRATGLVGFDETRIVRMRPLSRGRLTATKVELGAKVKAGQVIATYDNIEYGDLAGQLAVAQAGLAQARAEADTTRRAVERARELLSIGGIARAELERKTADQARAIAALRTQEAEIARVQERLRRFHADGAPTASGASPIMAPIDGVVIKIDAVPGELLDPDREIFTVADLATVWVQADVLEKDIGLIEPGQTASVSVVAQPDKRFPAQVSYVAQILDPKTNTARVRCVVANPDGALKLNMFATIDIGVPTDRRAVVVPPAAIQYVDEKPGVFVRRDAESFERRVVAVGVEDRGWIELTDGVAAGDAVVTTGSFQLKSILLRDRIAND